MLKFTAVRGNHSHDPFWTDYAVAATDNEAVAAVHSATATADEVEMARYIVRLQAIRALHARGKSVREIARILDLSKSRVARELPSWPAAIAEPQNEALTEATARLIARAWGRSVSDSSQFAFPSHVIAAEAASLLRNEEAVDIVEQWTTALLDPHGSSNPNRFTEDVVGILLAAHRVAPREAFLLAAVETAADAGAMKPTSQVLARWANASTGGDS